VAVAALAVAAVLGYTTLHGSGGAGDGTSVAQAPAGWSTVWSDGFDGSGRLSDQWLYQKGTSVPGGPANYGTGQIESNTDSVDNVFQRDGRLHIKAIRDAAGAWTSGRVETTRTSFEPEPGGVLAVEARLQLPDVTGATAPGDWPAVWMLGAPSRDQPWSWPGVGEIDIMENVQGMNQAWGTAHCGTAPGGDCNEKDGIGATTPGGSPSLQSAMHTYRVEWDRSTSPNEIRWYVDGRQYHSVSQAQMSPATWEAAFGHGFFVILNLAIGGEFVAKLGGGPTPETAATAEMVVDYVTVQARPGASG
jgi:beta-glucanase (GH16 family)